ncbi:MAG: RlmE family RNA methyltransferase [Bdellovibrionota bacterium]
MAYNPRDYYFLQAKAKNYAARSVFKLEEIDKRFHILKPSFKVLDLGAAPGSWSQYACKKIGLSGRLLGIDLQKINLTFSNAVFITGDLREIDVPAIASAHGIEGPFDVVLSDMAPKTTGIRATDQARSLELCETALTLAEKQLKPGGHFVCKMFHSDDFAGFKKKLTDKFDKVEILRPKSTRKGSTEIFFVALRRLTAADHL